MNMASEELHFYLPRRYDSKKISYRLMLFQLKFYLLRCLPILKKIQFSFFKAGIPQVFHLQSQR